MTETEQIMLSQQKLLTQQKNLLSQQNFVVSANLLRPQKCTESALVQHLLLSHHQGLC